MQEPNLHSEDLAEDDRLTLDLATDGHVKSADWKARRAEKLAICPVEVVNEVLARLAPLLGC